MLVSTVRLEKKTDIKNRAVKGMLISFLALIGVGKLLYFLPCSYRSKRDREEETIKEILEILRC